MLLAEWSEDMHYRPIAVEARVIWKLKLYMKPVLRLRSSKSTRHSAQDGEFI